MFSFLSAMTVQQWTSVSINSAITVMFFSLYWRTIWGRRATFTGLVFFPGLFFLSRLSCLVYVLSGMEWLSAASVFQYSTTLSSLVMLICGLVYGLWRQRALASCDVTTWSFAAISCELPSSPFIGLTLAIPIVVEYALNLQQVLWGISFQPTSNFILVSKSIEVAVGFCLGILMGDSIYYARDLLKARREVSTIH
jgi:hypothetical protein